MDPEYVAHYERLHRHHWWWRARDALLVGELRRLRFRPEARILDVGCGDASFLSRLDAFGRVEGVEPDASMLPPGTPHRDRIHLVPFDQFHPDARFDLILMLDVLEHVAEPEMFLRHGLELLASDGVLVITVPAFRLLWTTQDVLNHHRTRYTKPSFARLARRAGLHIHAQRYVFHWLFFAKLVVHAYEGVRRPVPHSPHIPAPWLNRMVYTVSRIEEHVLGPLRLPWGSSLLVIGGR